MPEAFDPSEFAAFKGGGKGAPQPSPGGFDPAEFSAFKSGGSDVPTPEGAMRIRVSKSSPDEGRGMAALRGAEQGLTLGFGDEGRGVAAASTFDETAPSWLSGSVARYSPLVAAGRLAEGVQNLIMDNPGARDRYGDAVEANRTDNAVAQSQHPAAFTAGEIGGGLAGAVATPMLTPFRAAQGAGLVARGAAGAGNLAATGAAYGGVQGFGAGEGAPEDRLPAAAKGAALGGIAAPALGGAVHGLAGAGRFVADNARAITSPGKLADRVVGRAVERDSADLAGIADRMEAANVTRRGARLELPDGRVIPIPEGKTVPPSSPFYKFFKPAEAEVGGQNLTLADTAGRNTQAVAGDVARMPGEGRTPARDFLEGRQVGSDTMSSQGERISERIGRILGDEGSIGAADAMMAKRKRDARPAFERAHAVHLDYGSAEGQKLLGLLERIPNEARASANQILRVSDREGHQMIWHPDEHGGLSLASVPNSRHFDYIKRGLDTMIDRNTNEVTGQVNTLGGALVGLKKEILGSLDKLNPAYAAARKQYAGETELLNALRDGQKAMAQNTTPEALRKSLKALSPGESEMFRLGASNALRDRVANAGDGVNKVKAVYGSPALRAKAQALIENEADRKALHAFLADESAMYRTRGEIGGSPTAERTIGAADTDGLISGAGHAAVQAAQGRVGAALRTVFDTMRKVNPELRGKVMNEARLILLNPDPAAVRAFAKRVADAEMKEGTRQRLLSALSAGLPRGMMPAPAGQ